MTVFAYALPADLRRGYNGLYALVVNELGRDPMDDDTFVFTNKRRNSCKVLRHDGSGMTIFMKRLDRGRFPSLWARSNEGEVELSAAELGLFLEGAQIVGYRRLSPLKEKSP